MFDDFIEHLFKAIIFATQGGEFLIKLFMKFHKPVNARENIASERCQMIIKSLFKLGFYSEEVALGYHFSPKLLYFGIKFFFGNSVIFDKSNDF